MRWFCGPAPLWVRNLVSILGFATFGMACRQANSVSGWLWAFIIALIAYVYTLSIWHDYRKPIWN
jgi:hypothetical protein